MELGGLAATDDPLVEAHGRRPSVGHAVAAALLAATPGRVTLDLFVASKCPDAPRCEALLAPLLREDRVLVRKMVIDAVLATDLSRHLEFLSRMRTLAAAGGAISDDGQKFVKDLLALHEKAAEKTTE